METQRFNQSFEELTTLLRSDDYYIASAAAQALGETGSSQAIPALLERFTATEEQVEALWDVAHALVKIGDESILSSMWNITNNPVYSRRVRRTAIFVVARLGNRGQALIFESLQNSTNEFLLVAIDGLAALNTDAAVEFLTKIIETETDPEVRRAAISSYNYPKDSKLLWPILKVAENRDDPLWNIAFNALAHFHNPETILPIVTKVLFEDKNREYRADAAHVLIKIDSGSVLPILLKGFLEDSYSRVRFTCAEGLWLHKDELNAKELIYGLYDTAANVRAEATNLLGSINDPQAIKPLLKLVQNEAEDISVREYAINSLGKLRALEAKNYLISLLVHKNNSLRSHAVVALANLGELDVFEILLKLLTDKSSGVRCNVIWALRQLNHPDTVVHLLKRLSLERNPDAREALVRNLGLLGDKRAVEPLLKEVAKCKAAIAKNLGNLDDNLASYMLAGCVRALAFLGDNRACDVVASFLQDADEDIQQTAMFALGKLGDSRGVTSLIYLLRDYNHSTRYQAITFLIELGEKALPALPTLDWLSQNDRCEQRLGEERVTTRQAAANAMEKIIASLAE